VRLHGSATFVSLARLRETLDRIPHGRAVHLDLHRLSGIDHTAAETVREWLARRRTAGQPVDIAGPAPMLRRLAAAGH